MIRNILEENDNVQPNDRTMEVLHREFPQCFNAEGKFDMVALQELLQDKVDLVKEGSGFNFLGKNYASLLSSMDTTTVLVPDTEHNEKPENKDSQNVYISGDNLDGLKHLLKSYSHKVKCIYIDSKVVNEIPLGASGNWCLDGEQTMLHQNGDPVENGVVGTVEV